MSIKTVQVEANQCGCEICSHEWISLVIPSACPNCHSRRWNGRKKAGRPRTIAQKIAQ